MLTVDHRCTYPTCDEKNIYRMVGSCSNCGFAPILILYSAGHEKDDVECPTCGNGRAVQRHSQRLATPEEIPVA